MPRINSTKGFAPLAIILLVILLIGGLFLARKYFNKNKETAPAASESAAPTETPTNTMPTSVPVVVTDSKGTISSSVSCGFDDSFEGYHVDVNFSYNLKERTSAPLWGTVTDEKTSKKVVFSKITPNYVGSNDYKYHAYIKSALGQYDDLKLESDGRIYRIRMFEAADSDYPSEGTTLLSTNFNIICPDITATPTP